MNKLLLGILFFASANVFGQDSTTTDKPALYYLYQNNFNMARKYSDPLAARNALYSMLSLDPADDSLRYTLAYTYFEARQYPSALLTCMDVIIQNPNHAAALEMSGICYEELGLKDKAISSYEKLYMLTDNSQTLYNLTYLQYELKRYNECEVNLDILMKSENINDLNITMQLNENEQKDFPLMVAALNLSGLVKKDQGDKEGARADFNKALELSPEFIFAKNNLEELDK
jgi:tetratricopeptide (TPR) repeat protein